MKTLWILNALHSQEGKKEEKSGFQVFRVAEPPRLLLFVLGSDASEQHLVNGGDRKTDGSAQGTGKINAAGTRRGAGGASLFIQHHPRSELPKSLPVFAHTCVRG